VAGKAANDPVVIDARTATYLRNAVFRHGWFDPASTEIGVEGLTPHELPHTAASLAVSAGAK
ncbi:MAG: hypothetical protein QOE37_1070, partial [Microbacteriaceae bacterium]|nr:hypothetical protein [Microbacteriaceae bacterium]